MCTSLTLLLLDHPPNPRPAFSPSQRPPMKSPKSANSFSSPLTSPTTGQSFQKSGQQQCTPSHPFHLNPSILPPSFIAGQDKSSEVLFLVRLSQKSWLHAHWIKSTGEIPQSHVSASALLRPWSTPAKFLEFEPHEVHHATHKMLPWNLFKPLWSFKAQLLPGFYPADPPGWPLHPFGLRGQDWPLSGSKCPFLTTAPNSQSRHSPDCLSSRSEDFFSGPNTTEIMW